MDQRKLIDLETELERREGDLQSEKNEANYDIDAQLRRWLTGAIKHSPLSRYQIAAAVSELLGKDISKYQVDTWTAESKEGYHLPSAYLPALCSVLDDFGALRIIAAPLPVQIVESKDAAWLELAKLRSIEKRLKVRRKQLEAKLQNDNEIPKSSKK